MLGDESGSEAAMENYGYVKQSANATVSLAISEGYPVSRRGELHESWPPNENLLGLMEIVNDDVKE